MKFSIFAQAMMAIPALATAIPKTVDTTNVVERANCKFTIQWKDNWLENALRRYRVQLITSPRNDEHLDIYCKALRTKVVELENLQCFWADGMFVVDISEAQGPVGHNQYKRQHNTAADFFGLGTGCDVVRNL
ncbi:hypothetical protein ACHAPU_002680 [Fusarium lateritium]